jgi:hypothetical protein
MLLSRKTMVLCVLSGKGMSLYCNGASVRESIWLINCTEKEQRDMERGKRDKKVGDLNLRREDKLWSLPGCWQVRCAVVILSDNNGSVVSIA